MTVITWHMLAPYVPVLLRVTLGFICARAGYAKLFASKAKSAAAFHAMGAKSNWSVCMAGWIEIVAGPLIVFGVLTRASASLLTLVILRYVYAQGRAKTSTGDLHYALSLLALLLSLLALGPGPLSLLP